MDDPGPPPTPAPAPTQTPSILLDTAVLLGLRVVYFLIARRYLLASLSPTLRELQRPEHVLPTATRERSTSAAGSSTRHASRASETAETPLVSDFDEETDITPGSSYPPSPRNVPASLQGQGEGSSSSPNTIELESLGTKLRDSPASPRVVQVTHAHADPTETKRAARELSRAARILFALCFAESLNLITIVAFHAIGILHAYSRRVNFSASLHIVLALVLLVVPLMQCMLFTYRSKGASTNQTQLTPDTASVSTRRSALPLRSRVLIALIPYALYIFLFTRIPPYITAIPSPAPTTDIPPGPNNGTSSDLPSPAPPSSEGWESGGWLASSLGRVIVLGVLVIAGLSGIGAVVTAWDYLEQAAGAKRPVSDADVLQAERSLYRVRHDIVSKREEIMRVAQSTPSEASGWVGRVFGTKTDQEAASLQAELGGLQLMEGDIASSLAAMKKRRRAQGFSHTLMGSVYNVLGYVFAIYCAARVVMCLISLLTPPKPTSTPNGDWISFVLALALSQTGGDLQTWSRTISLLLTGLLVISSLTMVLRWLGRVLRLTSRTVGAGFLLLFLGQLFVTYTISLLVQLRTSLPPPEVGTGDGTGMIGNTGGNGTAPAPGLPGLEAADNSLLRTLPDFRVFGRLFDAVFLLAATATAVYRYVAMKVNDGGGVYSALGR